MDYELDVKFSKLSLSHKGVSVVFASDGLELSSSANEYDEQSEGLVTRAAKIAKFNGKKKSFLNVLAPQGLSLDRLIVAGLGKSNGFSELDWLSLGGAIRGRISVKEAGEATIVAEGTEEVSIGAEEAAALAFGIYLRNYSFTKYKTDAGTAQKEKKNSAPNKDEAVKTLKKITIKCAEATKARQIFEDLRAVGQGVHLARDLVNEPANKLGPQEFADRAKALESLGVDVEILDEKKLDRLGAHALLGVGRGSVKPSYLVVMQWNGLRSKKTKPFAVVGKGVTFDSGGISIKPSVGMEDMKGDMGGAACVVGLMHAVAARKAKANVVGVIGLVENMVSGDAQRPGDVVTSMSGQTIEIINTDAEGRLVLADALWYTNDRFQPSSIVNLATLTGAILVALGKEYAGLFSNDDDLAEKLSAAGQVTGEKVWRLPLGPSYDKMIDSKVADMKNLGGRHAGSTTAAQFLQRFVGDVPWAHLDIAGTAMASPASDVSTGWASGYGVRLLNRLIADEFEQ